MGLQLKGWTKYIKFAIPSIMPFYVTGIISAAGGAWNASIICEYINWGENSVIITKGIGSYISEQYHKTNYNTNNIKVGVTIMCILVFFTNKFIWQKIYKHTQK